MANPNGRKGTQFEIAIVDYLREHGMTAERLPRSGQKDQGDGYRVGQENGFPHYWMWEAKNERRMDLPRYLSELETEQENFREARHLEQSQVDGIVIVKRRMHGIGKCYVVQTVDSYFGLGD